MERPTSDCNLRIEAAGTRILQLLCLKIYLGLNINSLEETVHQVKHLAADHAILIRKIRRERGLPLPLLPASLHQLKGTHQKNLKNLLCLKMTSSERTSIRKPLSSHPNDRHNYPQGQNWHLQYFQTPESKTEK